LTPLRALASEKYEEFKALQQLKKPDGNNVKVVISTGDYDSSGESLGAGDVIILTNERFDSILRHNVSWLEQVKLFVADEVHLVGDGHRGPTLETILTNILAFAPEAQLLALSATVNNAAVIADWLGAKLVDVKWRPVKLVEGVYHYNRVMFADGSSRLVEPSGRGPPIDTAIDSLKSGGQSLIFTETRRRAVSLATKASEVVAKLLPQEEKLGARDMSDEIIAEGEETELSRLLSKAVAGGAAFHHAGLSPEHRKIVEDGFRKGIIKILCATPTLAAGVNLPARRVVVSSLMRYDMEYGGQTLLSVLDYKQLAGRAGRPKFDSVGEVVIITPPSMQPEDIIEQYVKGEPEPLRSQLSNISALRTHILAAIATYPGMSRQDLNNLFSKTLFAIQYQKETVESRVSRGLDFLLEEDLVGARGSRFVATEFGRRVSMLYIDPATGVLFRDALRRVDDRGDKTIGILHLVVSCPDFTPKFYLRNQDWEEAIGFLEEHRNGFILQIAKERSLSFGDNLKDFRTLMAMYGWINEMHEDRLLNRYGVEPGDLHRATDNGDWLLYSLGEIAKLVGKNALVREIGEVKERNRYGIKKELIPLITLQGVGRVRARSLYNAGYISLEKVSGAKVEVLAALPKIGLKTAKMIKQQLLEKKRSR
ncbi:MAG: DEAD/DEAH box helicase, partial [Thaumarchaeota archaeon]|nr:DEAD/DEAH box helicase [Nitrososphaerota archaeon]